MSYYMVCFNNSEGFDSTQVHNTLTTLPIVLDWWHYLPNTYIVQTNVIFNPAKRITDLMREKFNELSFLVIKLDIRNYNGVLNKDAWEWLRKKNNQVLKFKTISRPLSTGLPNIPQRSQNLSSIQGAIEMILRSKK